MFTSIKKNNHSQIIRFLIPIIFCLGVQSYAQEQLLWFGTYTDEGGNILQGRYHIVKKGRALKKVILAPYGKSPMEFKVLKNDTVQRFVEISWPNKPQRVATLIQYTNGYYAGNFEDGTKILPMVIKEFNFQDAQLQGNWFKPSEVEVKIIENTIKLLSSDKKWNKSDDRICESNTTYSLFCALYQSSVTIDGEYRHLRPAIKYVREAIQKKYPKKYDHVLVDFNNAQDITLRDVHAILNTAKENLLKAIGKSKN
ncbi:hypothetical protein M0D21_17885 [Aquimarina sp. D1M17]|uniref:DUF6197 family protein n=1 Tax=Aquimarina acroporae TaxID=2937283 RepID=UPI0020BECA2E|nr:hypothetical protein [Aquimarina acroporae]MCK8523458.1 hypothetical protein [Aquimarina acroporae]